MDLLLLGITLVIGILIGYFIIGPYIRKKLGE